MSSSPDRIAEHNHQLQSHHQHHQQEHGNTQDGTGAGGVRKPKSNAATGASAAGIRALSAQFVAFYFRAPMKAFFRARLDYMAYARAINPRAQAGTSWSWHVSTPGLLAHAVKEHGWSFIPNQVLPPMLANVTVGAVLYTSYLQSLALLHEPSAYAARRVYPPPDPRHTAAAGAAAGAVQSLVAAPLDALQVRFKTNEMLEGRYKDMWHYAYAKLRAIGPQGVFAGYSLSLVKDAFGCALFFSVFEFVKAQMYYSFLTRWYGKMDTATLFGLQRQADTNPSSGQKPIIRPHYLIEPSFLTLAGVGASIAQSVVQHPITRIQDVHYGRLESLDFAAGLQHRKRSMFRLYYHAYEETFAQCGRQARLDGGWRRWLYRGFVWNTVRSTPSTSAGLIVFEIVRRKYADAGDVVRIEKDGYDILLT